MSWRIGDQCYVLMSKDDIQSGIVKNFRGKTYCDVMIEDINRRIPIKSLHHTLEQAQEANKKYTNKKGSTEVFPFWKLDDIKKIIDYFLDQKMYHHYLTFMLGLLLGRRVGDILSLKWCDFYMENGRIRMYLNIQEEKTKKVTQTRISRDCEQILTEYIA